MFELTKANFQLEFAKQLTADTELIEVIEWHVIFNHQRFIETLLNKLFICGKYFVQF